MCLAQGPQRSDAGEARTHGPSVLSQAPYQWATALPCYFKMKKKAKALGLCFYCSYFIIFVKYLDLRDGKSPH